MGPELFSPLGKPTLQGGLSLFGLPPICPSVEKFGLPRFRLLWEPLPLICLRFRLNYLSSKKLAGTIASTKPHERKYWFDLL